MSLFSNPFNPNIRLGAGCSCGQHRSAEEHAQSSASLSSAIAPTAAPDHTLDSEDALNRRVVETAVMRALFPNDATRRRFLHAVGSTTAMAAISSLLPLGSIEAMAQDKKVSRGQLTFILIRAIGESFIARGIARDDVRAYLHSVLKQSI